eukprot:TRINITY_DN8511_c0_g1_i1.p1 TRINITY_DN8511_c0_g1~~TRINITY_DN8511_c0_g1_i1.p1  ORF type:complete len:1104 (+),score=277.35 TRINITY_DN8511_c0_g1_i1:11-3322(+)
MLRVWKSRRYPRKRSTVSVYGTNAFKIATTSCIRNYCRKVPLSEPFSAKTVLIDGLPFMLRSYFTRPKNKDGADLYFENQALFFWSRFIINVLKKYDPDYLAVCMDSGKSFRFDITRDYKAHRKPIPSDFRLRAAEMKEFLEVFKIPIVARKSMEADDIIATLAKSANENNHQVTILSPDKDFCQVIRENVVVSDFSQKNGTWDLEFVREKWGIEPDSFSLLQAIMGDSADNIPGVPGFGPIKSGKIVRQCKTFIGLMENINTIDISEKDREKLKSHMSQIESNLVLTTLKVDVDTPRLADLIRTFPEEHEVHDYFEMWEMKKLKNYVDGMKSLILDVHSPFIPPTASDKYKHKNNGFPSINISHETSPDDFRHEVHSNCEGISVVNDFDSAQKALQELYKFKDRYHACDTEVIDIDIKKTPIGNGKVICITIYVGPDADFGNGPKLFINNIDHAEGVIDYFKDYLEDDSIKKVWHNYSFDKHVLSNHNISLKGFGGDTIHMARLWDASRRISGGYALSSLSKDVISDVNPKIPMKERFSRYKKLKNGENSKAKFLPPLDELQRDPHNILDWLDYATLDAELTWRLRSALQKKLEKKEWKDGKNMWDYYNAFWLPFGELLTEMEKEGIRVDTNYIKSILPIAIKEKEKLEESFLEWASEFVPDCKFMNPSSVAQKQQLFFAPDKRGKKKMELERTFNVLNTDGYIEEGKVKPLKNRPLTIRGLGMDVYERTASGYPAASSEALKRLCGDPPKNFGSAKEFFDKLGSDGEKACYAISDLVKSSSIETLISGFIQPLPGMADENERVHCSLNINTETGRLSARRPNLQNQPAHEKDRYKIRKGFCAMDGNMLIVADYGQLELRLLAHVTKCKSMLDAFSSGGDFHSRTAVGMYPEIQEAIDQGKVLLEWDEEKGEPPVPLVKDIYGTERRRAKTLNFSIAYGKTVHGFAKDWNVSSAEAMDVLEKWYADRPEVRQWQKETIQNAKLTGWTRTLCGRYRELPEINNESERIASHHERAAINTPLQGGAADIMVACMVKLYNDEYLKELGYKQIMQIHDEVILEGPEDNAEKAMEKVIEIMENPLDEKLLVDLKVDAKTAKTWYEAK